MKTAAPEMRPVVTPEGVAISFQVAPVLERLVAFGIDCFLVGSVAFVLVVVLGVAAIFVGELAVAGFLFLFFMLRAFYFSGTEWWGNGRTPGKRMMKIRVIDAAGGSLSGEAVFARNLSREIEIFLPLLAVLAPESMAPDLPWWARIIALVWVVALAVVPFASRDRQRGGDLLAGTLVVRTPTAPLLPDLSAHSADAAPRVAAAAGSLFTQAQLDLYGIYELQVLEQVLRGNAPDRHEALFAIATKVQAKIGWTGPEMDAEAFLTAFYAAQRKRLEQRMVLGQRRERKKG